MKLHDVIIAAILLAVALAIGVHASSFPPMPGQAVGPGFFPTLVAAGIALGALVLAAATIARRAGGAGIEFDEWARAPRRLVEVFLVAGGVAFYVLFSESLGYFIAAPAALLMFLLATRTRLLIAVPIAALVPLLIHWIFYTGLRVPLPWGLLTEHAW
jgi:putative tricarboxylic transport membrane protein